MRSLVGAWDSLGLGGDGGSHADHELEIGHEGSGTVAWPGHRRGGRPSSFIRRCWFQDRKCDESSTCSDLRALWEGIREDVDVLPPPKICGRAQYIVTGASKSSRNGVIDDNRLESLLFPGEKWHKCCVIVNPAKKHAQPQFVCEHLKEIPRMKLMKEMKGWCGPHKCIGMRDRCLVVDEVKTPGFVPKFRGECPMGCKGKCDKLTQKFECVYIGEEPKLGTEGQETPTRAFGESEMYDVIGLQTLDNSDKSSSTPDPSDEAGKDPLKASTEEPGEVEVANSCAPLEVAFFLPVPAVADHRAMRHRDWNRFLS